MGNVVTTSERLLEVMDKLTNQYDLASKDILGEAGAIDRTHLASTSSERWGHKLGQVQQQKFYSAR
jgi:hypothetical protein